MIFRRLLWLLPLIPALYSQAQTVIEEPWNWRLPNDAAGGNCTGFVFHPLDPEIRYVASGDTGGYRWNQKEERWICFTDWNAQREGGYVIGIAIDPTDTSLLYYAAGNGTGDVYKSRDRGRTFAASNIRKTDGSKSPYINGGEDASTRGDVLALDPNNTDLIYLASRLDGLFRSSKASEPGSWSQVTSFTPRGDVVSTKKPDGTVDRAASKGGGLSFIVFDKNSGKTDVNGEVRTKVMYVGVVGDRRQQTSPDASLEVVPEGGVWRSEDGGETWALIPGPNPQGNAPLRAEIDSEGTLYVTFGKKVGKIARGDNSVTDLNAPVHENRGFQAITVDPGKIGHIVIVRGGVAPRENSYSDVNRIYRSVDGGKTWMEIKRVEFNSPPWWDWFASPTHWVKFDPHSPKDEAGFSQRIWLGDWIGPWRCENILIDVPRWELVSRGRGGTYSMAIATPPAKVGASIAPVIMQGADFDGFRYISLTSVPGKRLTQSAAHVNDGIADGTSVAFCETDPSFVAAVGGYDHGERGAGGSSTDNGVTWRAFEGKGLKWPGFGRDPKLGRVAVSATKLPNGYPALVWIPRFQTPRYSHDWGASWKNVTGFYPLKSGLSICASEWDPWQVLAADPVDGRVFYAYVNNLDNSGKGQIFRSEDYGVNWSMVGTLPFNWKERRMNQHHLLAMPGKKGNLWLCLRDEWSKPETSTGLHRSYDGGVTWTRIQDVDQASAFAFGAPAPGRDNPSLFLAGTIAGQHGIFVSDDATAFEGALEFATWRRIWNHKTNEIQSVIHCLKSMGADRQSYGRIYAGSVGTGRGMFYGEQPRQVPPNSPSNITVRPSINCLTVEWTDPIGAESYTLSRSAANDKAPQIVADNLKESRYVDTSAEPGRTYSYRVTASNQFGTSQPSQAASGVIFSPIKPMETFGSPGIGSSTYEKAFDGDRNTAFDAQSASGAFTGAGMGREVQITKIRFQPRDWNGARMKRGEFQGAATKEGPWITIHEIQGEPASGLMTEVNVTAPGRFAFLRYIGPDNGHCNIKEVEFYEGGQSGN